MKSNYKNKIIIFIIIALLLTYFFINIFPELVNKQVNTNSRGIITSNNDMDLSNSKASIDTITRTDKVYYNLAGAIPTNKVWSSAVFNGVLTGLYTFPYASKTANGVLQVTVPTKQVYEKLVAAQISSDVLSLTSQDVIDKVYVDSFDDISVTFLFKGTANQDLFTATYIQGSPYIFIKPKQNTFKIEPAAYTLSKENGSWVYNLNDKKIGVFSNGDFSDKGNTLNLKFSDLSNAYITLAAGTTTNFDIVKQYAANIITSVSSEYKIDGEVITQSYNFHFKDNGSNNTIFGLLPNQYQASGYDIKNSLFTINTLRGDQLFFKVDNSKISYNVPREAIANEIIPENFSDSDKAYLTTLIEKDLQGISFIRPTTYFGGNDILKLARLLQLADIVKNQNLFDRIKLRLETELADWFTYKDSETSKYFAYDKSFGGIMGFETGGFGEEKYNDHHFQYGYFIHAAAIVASYDKQFLNDYGDLINLLIKDIANTDKSDESFPYMRYFDSYEGHSWATGYADVLDGNNQESSSEAINAWYGIWMWSKVTNNSDLTNTSEYLYSSEINATRTYWLNWYNNTSIFPTEYNRNKASLIWGGKFEYQTFFSLEPQSIEAIQYLPITPGSLYLYNYGAIERDFSSFKDNLKDTSAHLNDFNYLYYAMTRGFGILDRKTIETMDIDQGQSRANMFYWTLFWDKVSGISKVNVNGVEQYKVVFKDGKSSVLN